MKLYSIKCSNKSCDYKTPSVLSEVIGNYLNLPCPKCTDTLLNDWACKGFKYIDLISGWEKEGEITFVSSTQLESSYIVLVLGNSEVSYKETGSSRSLLEDHPELLEGPPDLLF
jgi:hypothetical protein